MSSWKKLILKLMTLFKRRNSSDSKPTSWFRSEPYLKINIFLAGVILLIFAYSGFFSPVKDNYPIQCIHEKLTGEPCISCGMSHSFSLILRGKISESFDWNIYGLRIFLFFALQLVMRGVFSVLFIRIPGIRRPLIICDIVCSVVLFLAAFMPYLVYIFRSLV